MKVYHFSIVFSLCIGSFWITKEKLWTVPMLCGQQARWFDDMYILPVRKMFSCSFAIASLEVRYKRLSIVICEPGILLPCYRTSMTRFCQQACCADTQQQHSFEDPDDSSLFFLHDHSCPVKQTLELVVKALFAFEVQAYCIDCVWQFQGTPYNICKGEEVSQHVGYGYIYQFCDEGKGLFFGKLNLHK